MDLKEFYKELGRLAYAVARADGVIQSEEVDKVCDLIGLEIANTGDDSYDKRDVILGAASEFNRLRTENASVREAFNGFTAYMEKNPTIFEPRIKNLCMKVALRIAGASEGVNETESALLDKLKKKLESIN